MMPQYGYGLNGNDDVELGKARTVQKACRSKTMIGLKVILVLNLVATIGMVAFTTIRYRSVERDIRIVQQGQQENMDKIDRLEKAVESNEKSLISKKYSDHAKESDNLQTILTLHGRINLIVDQRNEDIKAIYERINQQEIEMVEKIDNLLKIPYCGDTMPESKTDKKSCHKCHKIYDKKLKQRKVCKCHAITYCGVECQIADWPRHQDNCLPVMVTEVEDKGRGLVASRNIKMGEQILVDTAVIPLSVPDGVVTRMVARSLKNQIHDLSEEKETKFYKLETSVKNLSISEVKIGKKENCLRELQIFQNSQLRDEITPGLKEYELLFFTLSLINHSCAPNTEWAVATFSKEEDEIGVYELRATKDIYKGEEITMFYLDDMDLPLGQKWLDPKLGFNCKCNVCYGILDGQERIVMMYFKLFTTLSCGSEMYKMGPEDWKKQAIKCGMMVALTKQLYVGRAETKRKACTGYACAAHMARDPVLLEKAMAEWKELMMNTDLEYMRTGYKTFEEKHLAKWSSDFKSKNPPSIEEINIFYNL